MQLATCTSWHPCIMLHIMALLVNLFFTELEFRKKVFPFFSIFWASSKLFCFSFFWGARTIFFPVSFSMDRFFRCFFCSFLFCLLCIFSDFFEMVFLFFSGPIFFDRPKPGFYRCFRQYIVYEPRRPSKSFGLANLANYCFQYVFNTFSLCFLRAAPTI